MTCPSSHTVMHIIIQQYMYRVGDITAEQIYVMTYNHTTVDSNTNVCVLELQVELFPSLEGSSQERGLRVDSALLRNGEELMLWTRQNLQQLCKLWPTRGIRMPGGGIVLDYNLMCLPIAITTMLFCTIILLVPSGKINLLSPNAPDSSV